MQNRESLITCLLASLVAVLSGCATHAKQVYLGQTGQLDGIPTPAGFHISPQDAEMLLRETGHIKKSADSYYHDDRNYLIVDALQEEARKGLKTAPHTVINGQTGQVQTSIPGIAESTPSRKAEQS